MQSAKGDLQVAPEVEQRREEPLLRRAGDRTPLGAVIGRIEYAFGTGDHAHAAELLERDLLAAWFGFEPTRFGDMLLALGRSGAGGGLLVRIMTAVLFSNDPDSLDPAELVPGEADAASTAASAALTAHMFSLRLQGRPVEALQVSAELEGGYGVLQPLFDSTRGWSLFTSVQLGLTAMLAGDFAQALQSLTQARMHVVIPHLAFLSRDACVKEALLEALYGDVDRARSLLDEAEGVPRTESWAERGIDATFAIVAALVREENAAEALALLESVPMREVGEMWPFYVVAFHRVLSVAGRIEEDARRLALFERLPLPRVEGQGYAGSALLLAGAMNSMMLGDLPSARERLERADGGIAATRVLSALLELTVGRPREALQLTAGLHEQTRGLRLLEVWRLATISGSHFALGAQEECRDVLEFVLGSPAGLSLREAQFFPVAVRRFAEAEIEGWPMGDGSRFFGFETFLGHGEALTAREVDVLRELAGGRSREEIARAQFISMNTLKAHLRSIYRKLGVGSRAAAVLEAERRGIV